MARRFSLSQLQQHALVPDLPEDRLVKLLKSLSDIFTKKRQLADYVFDRELISAYSCFYLPTNALKYQFVLQQLPPSLRAQMEEVVFIDYGCGPGTFALAHLAFCQQKVTPALYFVDQSPLMLEQARRYLAHFFPEYRHSYFQSQLELLPEHRAATVKKCFFLGHSINEMSVPAVVTMIQKVAPEFVFFIDIGQRHFFSQALAIRQQLTATNFQMWYPCPASTLACPLAHSQTNWCHQVLELAHAPDLERLAQLVQLDRRSMPMIAHFYQHGSSATNHLRTSPETPAYLGRIFRKFPPSKFAFHWEVCLHEQVDNQQVIIQLELPKKWHQAKQFKMRELQMVGEQLLFTREKVLAPDKWRVIVRNLDE